MHPWMMCTLSFIQIGFLLSSSLPGLLDVRQLPYLNCLVCDLPDNKDLAFKLKRKQFTIEVGLCHHNNPLERVVT
jgi:hypothetical protein